MTDELERAAFLLFCADCVADLRRKWDAMPESARGVYRQAVKETGR